MTVGVPTCKLDTPIADIARFLLDRHIEAMCVLDGEGNGIGVVGIDELVNAYRHADARSLTAEDVMTEGMPTLPADMTLTLAVQFMRDKKTRIAYMTHNAAGIIYPAAYITFRHIIRHLAAKDEKELKDLGIAAERKLPIEQFIERRNESRKKAGLIYREAH